MTSAIDYTAATTRSTPTLDSWKDSLSSVTDQFRASRSSANLKIYRATGSSRSSPSRRPQPPVRPPAGRGRQHADRCHASADRVGQQRRPRPGRERLELARNGADTVEQAVSEQADQVRRPSVSWPGKLPRPSSEAQGGERAPASVQGLTKAELPSRPPARCRGPARSRSSSSAWSGRLSSPPGAVARRPLPARPQRPSRPSGGTLPVNARPLDREDLRSSRPAVEIRGEEARGGADRRAATCMSSTPTGSPTPWMRTTSRRVPRPARWTSCAGRTTSTASGTRSWSARTPGTARTTAG